MLNLFETIFAPPFIKREAPSGTTRTLTPSQVKSYLMEAIAVVLPAQWPPVMQILAMFSRSMLFKFLAQFIGGLRLTFSYSLWIYTFLSFFYII